MSHSVLSALFWGVTRERWSDRRDRSPIESGGSVRRLTAWLVLWSLAMAWSSRRLVFAGLAVLLLAPALLSSVGGVLAACGDSEEEEEYYYVEDEYLESIEIRTSILVIATTLIILSILFEVGKEKVEETTGEEMEPIIEHLWQEMTVLGFLSVLTFLVTYVGLLDPISCAIFDECSYPSFERDGVRRVMVRGGCSGAREADAMVKEGE